MKVRYKLGDLGVDERIILKGILNRNSVGRCGLDSSCSGYGPVADPCEQGNEPSGSIKRGFLTS